MTEKPNYRTRIYENYATNFQDASNTFDDASAWHWGRAYRHYLRGWLPDDKNASTALDILGEAHGCARWYLLIANSDCEV